MPAPATLDDFLKLAHRSGLLAVERADAYLRPLRAAGALPETPRALARALVRDACLTFFQAEQLLLGKSRGFGIGRYDVLERLGTGGMGVVYLCRHKFMRRPVALKVLASTLAEDAAALELFYREAECVAALDHPNIVRAYDVGKDGPFHYLVMEYVEGASLDKIIHRNGPVDVRWASHVVCQAALGLQHAHENGLVHRDVKPANLMVDPQGVVKLLDLGLARFFRQRAEGPAAQYPQVLGTADYLAPEQALDSNRADIRSDIYSLGATFHYLLAGQPPFVETTVAKKLMAHQLKPPRPITQLRPDVPPELTAVIDRMLAKDPARRYPTPAAVIDTLVPLTRTPIPDPPPFAPPRLSPLARQLLAQPTGPAKQWPVATSR